MTTQPTTSTRPRRRRGARIAAGTAVGVVVLTAGAYGVGYAMSGGTLAPQASIEGVAVGGLTPEAATQKLTTELASRAEAPMTVTYADKAVTKTPDELGLGVDYAASARAAGAEKSFDPLVIWENLTGGGEHEAVVVRDDAKLASAVDELAQQANVDPTNAELVFEEGAPVVKDATAGVTVDPAATADALAAAYLDEVQVPAVANETPADITTEEAQSARETIAVPALSAPITITAGEKTFDVTPAMVAASLAFEPTDGVLAPVFDADTLMEQASTAMEGLGTVKPKDASFTFSDGKPTVVPSVDGMGVGKDDLVRAVSEAMVKTSDRTASVTVAPQEAEFTTAEAEALGVKEITGEFSTKFPATAYRVNNIGKSASLINGYLVKPGETFSMNKALGPRTLARGWMAGGAIDGGKVVERMGGGISQTTTTAFNAIFFAGLEDVYHKPHSLYFSRYPMGREATLDYNSVNFKFKNNTDYGVVLQAFTNNPKVGGEGTVTVRVWSTKIYDVKATDPVKSNIKSPGPAIQNNAAVCSPQSAMSGFTVNFSRQFYKNGELVKSEPFTWTYNSLTPVVCTNPNARADRIER